MLVALQVPRSRCVSLSCSAVVNHVSIHHARAGRTPVLQLVRAEAHVRSSPPLPAAGGHNVVTGLFDYLQAAAPGSTVLGVLGGTLGLFAQKTMPLTKELLADYRNQGGYHLLGRSVDRIRSAKEVEAAVTACSGLNLDGLVIVGGTHSVSDAAHLAEAARAAKCTTKIVGVPVSIDGDLGGPFVEANLGFDTATKVYAELVGNLETDCNSAKK